MPFYFHPFFKIFLALILGAIIGLEREKKKKGAGLQTYSLVALSSALFSTIAFTLGEMKIVDPSLAIMAIGVGMGFIGSGVIFKQEGQLQGLTTAAGLWASAAVGLAIGAGLYSLAFFSTFLILFIFVFFGFLEEKFL
jgi:putative Mg2+ transporter-C (MgtC) family protein